MAVPGGDVAPATCSPARSEGCCPGWEAARATQCTLPLQSSRAAQRRHGACDTLARNGRNHIPKLVSSWNCSMNFLKQHCANSALDVLTPGPHSLLSTLRSRNRD